MDRLDLIESGASCSDRAGCRARRVQRLADPVQLKRRWETLTELQRLTILRWVHLDMQLMDDEDSCQMTQAHSNSATRARAGSPRRQRRPRPNRARNLATAAPARCSRECAEPPGRRNRGICTRATCRPAATSTGRTTELHRSRTRRTARQRLVRGAWALATRSGHCRPARRCAAEAMQYVHQLESHATGLTRGCAPLAAVAHIGGCGALSTLVAKFKHVFFVPGNHDLWLMRARVQCRARPATSCCA